MYLNADTRTCMLYICIGGAVCPSTTLVAQGMLAAPAGMAITSDGSKAFVAEFVGHKISIVDIATGTVSALAGTGQAGYKDNTVGTRAEFSSPTDVKLTPDGLKVLVTDLYNNKIRSVDLATRQRFSNSIHLPFGAIWYRLCRVADFSEFLQ
jgi:DNA-binding beta-propeller fold protein YncE